jgi:hypothetical protein
MGSLSNLYISQSFQSLIHLGNDGPITTASIELQDGLGNGLGLFVNSNGDISSSGNFYAANLTGSAGPVPSGTISGSAQITALGFVSSSITASSLITASFNNGTRDLTFTKGDNTTFNVNIPDVSGSAGDFVTTASFNSYTASTDSSISELNASTASQQISIDALNTNSASVNTSITNVNSATASLFTSVNNINTFTQSAEVSINALNGATASYANSASVAAVDAAQQQSINSLNSATASYVTSAITASSLVTASFSGNTLTFTKGDASTFGVVIPDISGSTIDTGSFATTGSNAFIGNQTIAGGLLVSSSQPIAFSGSSFVVDTFNGGGAIIFRPGTSIQFQGNTDFTGPIRTTIVNVDNLAGGGFYGFNNEATGRIYQDFSGSVDSRINAIVTGTGFATTGSNTFTGNQNIEGTLTASLQEGYAWVGNGSNVSTLVATSSFGGGGTIDTGSFATTGSNTFTGNQTITTAGNTQLDIISTDPSGQANVFFQSFQSNFQAYGNFTVNNNGQFGGSGSMRFVASNNNLELASDAGNRIGATNGNGNGIDAGFVSMQVRSGSLSLAPAGFTNTTASLLHLSSSSNINNINLVFKNNNGNPDTIISGSSNIFTNPANVTAGFKRYIGGSNNYYGLIPQLTASAGFSPVMGNNIINTGVIMRTPISSSTYTMNGNVLMNPAANGVQFGPAAAQNFERAVSGLGFNNNFVNGTITATAFKTPLSGGVNISNNNIGATVALNMDSSSVSFINNIAQGSLTVNNSYHPSTYNAASALLGYNGNISLGTNIIFASGSNTTFTGPPRTIINTAMIGTNNVLSASLNGDNSQIHSTSLLGQGLIALGTNTRPLAASAADWGSVFVGRWNAIDGVKDQTAETVFAVGTGTGTATRKTGFLIDSGSNTFVEGTLNVSGATSLNGDLIITGSLTASLAQGFTYVGDASGRTTLVATSSFGGGATIDTGSFAITGSNLFRGNQIVSGTFAVTDGGSRFSVGIVADQIVMAATNADLIFSYAGDAKFQGDTITLTNTGSTPVATFRYTAGDDIWDSKVNQTGISGSYIISDVNSNKDYLTLGGTSSNATINVDTIVQGTLNVSGSTTITGSLTIQSGSAFFANGNKQFNVGAFSSLVTQSGSAGVSQSVNFEVTDKSEGVSIASNSRITLANSGTYSITFSAQVLADGGQDTLWMWLKKNGTNVANTSTKIIGKNGEETVLTVNYVVDAVANDYYELVWENLNGYADLLYEVAGTNYPAIPSVILTVTQVR